jgi:hypothetical protein
MGVPMAPWGPPVTIPPVYVPPQKQQQQIVLPALPGSDNTECNYLVMFFVAGVFLMALGDSMKGKA